MKIFLKRSSLITVLALFCFIPFQANAAMVGQGSFTLDFSPHWNIATSDTISMVFYDGRVAVGETYVEVDRLSTAAVSGTASISIIPVSNPAIFTTLTDGTNDQITFGFSDSSIPAHSGGAGLSERVFFNGITANGIDFGGYTLDEVVFSFVGDLNAETVVATITAYGTVPVPSALWLMASGILGLAGVARRKKA